MSKYTTQLRWIVEQEQGQVPFSEETRYTDATFKKLGLSEYPIFDEDYRPLLNAKIIDHFYFREIGFETAAQFAWYMRRTLNEIMPYYNEMYVTQAMIDDPLSDYDMGYSESWDAHVEDDGTIQDNGSDSNSGETHSRDVYQDTPMSLLSNVGSPSVVDLDYATNVTYDDAASSSSGTHYKTKTLDTDRNDHGWRVHDEKGRRKSQSKLMQEYRDVFKNIDLEVIEELETLFMGLW